MFLETFLLAGQFSYTDSFIWQEKDKEKVTQIKVKLAIENLFLFEVIAPEHVSTQGT